MSEKSEIQMQVETPVPEVEAPAEVTYGGFKTPEELVAAYEALKTPAKIEGTEVVDPPAEVEKPALEIPAGDEGAQKVVEGAGLDWAALNTEYAESGKLSEETYASLEKAGLPRVEVDTYIRGKQADADAYDAAVYGTAGGTEAYGSLIEWAKTNLTDAEKIAFNESVTSGNPAKAKLAVEALAGRHAAKRGAPPSSLLNGKKAATGVQPFKSQVEVTAAMRSPAYKSDPAFRAEVVERLRLSEF